MITLYAFATIFPAGRGETKDLRVQWALEELGLPYRIQPLDHTGGELQGEAFGRLNPFRQAPVIDDGGFVLTESAAIVLYLAEKAGRLMPAEAAERTRVIQWCFSAVSTVEPTLIAQDFAEIFDPDHAAAALHEQVRVIAGRWLGGLEQRLGEAGREWIACADFTAADIVLAGVLRTIRKTDLMAPFPKLKAYVARCFARPAWQRTLALTAERLGTTVEAIR